jgi:hypothetical protein
MYASCSSSSRRAIFAEPASKSQRLNYEGDVKTLFNQQHNVVNIKSQKMFCKVCHDAGKPESIYTGHFVRASPLPNAPVVCPTLLAQLCRYCGVAGHTVKYCPRILNNTTQIPCDIPKHVNTTISTTKLSNNEFDKAINRFSALAIDVSDTSSVSSEVESQSETEDASNNMVVDEFDEVKNLSLQTLTAMLSSILQMNPTSNNKLVIAIENAISFKTKANKTRPAFCSPVFVAPANKQQQTSKDWADYDDDEEIDFTADLPNFPQLPPPLSLKRSYSDILKH